MQLPDNKICAFHCCRTLAWLSQVTPLVFAALRIYLLLVSTLPMLLNYAGACGADLTAGCSAGYTKLRHHIQSATVSQDRLQICRSTLHLNAQRCDGRWLSSLTSTYTALPWWGTRPVVSWLWCLAAMYLKLTMTATWCSRSAVARQWGVNHN